MGFDKMPLSYNIFKHICIADLSDEQVDTLIDVLRQVFDRVTALPANEIRLRTRGRKPARA